MNDIQQHQYLAVK